MATWIVVADRRIARIFEADGAAATSFKEVRKLMHVRNRGDFVSHADSGGGAVEGDDPRHRAAGSPALEREREVTQFARQVAAFLYRECGRHAFGDLVLIAEPHFMGALRNAFDRRYETAAYYNQPGREWSLALRWRPH